MENALNKWIDLVSQQNTDEVVSLYAENGLLLGTFSDEIRVGEVKIREYFDYFLAKKPQASVIDSKTHVVDENNFSVNGFYDFEVDGSNGQRELAHARFTFVFQKQNGTFKILSHHSSIMP